MAAPNMRKAREVYGVLLGALESMDWKHTVGEEELSVNYIIENDDFSIGFSISLHLQNELIELYASMPLTFPEDLRAEGAIATTAINYKLRDGSFDLDLADGKMLFRMTSSYCDTLIGHGLFRYMINTSSSTVFHYVNLLYLLAEGEIDIDSFLDDVME
jgi:hypothetical protein